MRWILLFIGILFFGGRTEAFNNQPRFDFQTNYIISDKWTNISSLGYVRYIDETYPGYRIQIRSSMSRVLNNKTEIKGGAYIHIIDQVGFGEYLEIRPWLGYKFNIFKSIPWMSIENFVRYEYRGHIALNSESVDYANHVLRYRLLFKPVVYSNLEKNKQIKLEIGAEAFASSEDKIIQAGYNRLRLLSGIDYKANKKWNYSIDFAQEFNQSGELDLSELNTLIIFMGIRRTIFPRK